MSESGVTRPRRIVRFNEHEHNIFFLLLFLNSETRINSGRGLCVQGEILYIFFLFVRIDQHVPHIMYVWLEKFLFVLHSVGVEFTLRRVLSTLRTLALSNHSSSWARKQFFIFNLSVCTGWPTNMYRTSIATSPEIMKTITLGFWYDSRACELQISRF